MPPLALREDGETLHVLRLPEGEIEYEVGLKLTIPEKPLNGVTVTVTGAELAPGAETITDDGLAARLKSVPGWGLTVSFMLTEDDA
jgi:hypothetical protein